MTTMPQDLRTFIAASTAVTALVSSRIHYNYAPAVATKPHIWFRVNSDREELTMDGAGGIHESTVDVECVGSTPDSAQVVGEAIKTRLHGYKGTLGNITCKGAFIADKDDDYIPYNNQADDGSHVCAYTLTLWYST